MARRAESLNVFKKRLASPKEYRAELSRTIRDKVRRNRSELYDKIRERGVNAVMSDLCTQGHRSLRDSLYVPDEVDREIALEQLLMAELESELADEYNQHLVEEKELEEAGDIDDLIADFDAYLDLD